MLYEMLSHFNPLQLRPNSLSIFVRWTYPVHRWRSHASRVSLRNLRTVVLLQHINRHIATESWLWKCKDAHLIFFVCDDLISSTVAQELNDNWWVCCQHGFSLSNWWHVYLNLVLWASFLLRTSDDNNFVNEIKNLITFLWRMPFEFHSKFKSDRDRIFGIG